MPKLDVKNIQGETVGSVELSDAVFGAEVKEHLLWEVVRAQRAGRRAGTAKTKGRSEVRGGGAKPYRQKGTGRARQGTIRAPQFVGGGAVFGPRPRRYRLRVPKQVRRGALRSALSLRARDEDLVVVDTLELEEIKTRRLREALDELGVVKALLVEDRTNQKLTLSARNLPDCKVLPPEGVNVYDVLKHDKLVLTTATARAPEQRLMPRRTAAAGTA
jgi:large subunit ribosomal protein L4